MRNESVETLLYDGPFLHSGHIHHFPPLYPHPLLLKSMFYFKPSSLSFIANNIYLGWGDFWHLNRMTQLSKTTAFINNYC